MRATMYFLVGVVLAALSLGAASSNRAVEAQSKSHVSGKPASAVTKKSAGVPLHRGWRIGSPISFEKLSIFPVLSDQSTHTPNFITLDEGLRSGKVTITEIGANGRSRRLRRGETPSEDADVNELMLTNRSGKMLILIAGEIVVGGNQDRIVGHDCIVASSAKPVPLDVFCVEHGRWSERPAFGRSNDIEANNGRAARVGGGTGGGLGSVSGGVAAGVLAPQPPPPTPMSSSNFSLALDVMASPKVREKAQSAKDQSAVWTEVAEAERVNNVSSSTGTLNAVFENKEVSAKIDPYEQALKDKLPAKGVVGIVVAIGSSIVSTDVFANSQMFRAYWPKLLRSYALEAMGDKNNDGTSADSKAAEAFLRRVAGKKLSDGRKRVYRLVEHESDDHASFELVSTTKKQSSLIHFNRVTKD